MGNNKTLDDLFKQSERLNALLNGMAQHTARIPSIEKVSNKAHRGVLVLFEKIEKSSEDINKIEEQLREILIRQQTDIEEGIKTRSIAKQARSDINEHRDSQRTMRRALLGVIITIVLTLCGSVFFVGTSLGSLSTRVDEQSKTQETSTKRLEIQFNRLHTATQQMNKDTSR